MPETVPGSRQGTEHQSGRRTRWGPGIWIGLWAACNLALGIVLAYPLLLLAVIGLHARAMLFDRPDSPFSNNEIQGGEADGFIPFGIVAAVLILAVVTGINWLLIRRLRLPSAASKAGIVAVTGALLIAPALLIV